MRLREQVPPDMVAVPIGPPVAMVACASPDYLRRHRSPRQPRDLADHECIRQRLASGSIYRWEFERAGRPIVFEPQGSLTCNDIGVMVAAASCGQGIAFTTSHHVRRHFETGQLVQVLAEFSPPSMACAPTIPAAAIRPAPSAPSWPTSAMSRGWTHDASD